MNLSAHNRDAVMDLGLFVGVILFTALATSPLFAQDGKDGEVLAREYRCYACHDLTDNLIGPSYQAIAARHVAQKDVMEKVLATKIIRGGGGNWGVVPMVPNEHVPEADALTLSRWILDLSADL